MIEIKYGRKFLLEMMPKNSVCAEIGVNQGAFSEEILEVVVLQKNKDEIWISLKIAMKNLKIDLSLCNHLQVNLSIVL